jgi:hypothetical protein
VTLPTKPLVSPSAIAGRYLKKWTDFKSSQFPMSRAEMVLEMVYSPLKHLTWLLVQEQFIEFKVSTVTKPVIFTTCMHIYIYIYIYIYTHTHKHIQGLAEIPDHLETQL